MSAQIWQDETENPNSQFSIRSKMRQLLSQRSVSVNLTGWRRRKSLTGNEGPIITFEEANALVAQTKKERNRGMQPNPTSQYTEQCGCPIPEKAFDKVCTMI